VLELAVRNASERYFRWGMALWLYFPLLSGSSTRPLQSTHHMCIWHSLLGCWQ
jgi:hypothetical protein